MNRSCCNCKFDCVALSVIASIIIGVIGVALTFTGTITATPAFLWVTLGFAVAYLAVLLVAAAISRTPGTRDCPCRILPAVFTGIFGTALTSLILLGVTFAATSFIGALITGALLAFLTLALTTIACLIQCFAGCSCDED